MDFGIARAIADASSTMTQTAAVVGTAQYLSPEQARGETVDSRSDVYSTGCLLYELLTGRPPFVGDSPVSVAYQHVREQAAPPSTLDPELPARDRRDRDEVAGQATSRTATRAPRRCAPTSSATSPASRCVAARRTRRATGGAVPPTTTSISTGVPVDDDAAATGADASGAGRWSCTVLGVVALLVLARRPRPAAVQLGARSRRRCRRWST